MARFLYHTACPICGSSDALGIYDDGSSYCFSHGKPVDRSNKPPSTFLKQEEPPTPSVKYPPDITTQLHPDALEWLSKYEVYPTTIYSRHLPIYYSPGRHQLIFGFEDENKQLLAWQARNLGDVSKSKRYFTKGDIQLLLPIYHHNLAGSRRLVLVEDCVSAIKCSNLEGLQADAMPLLGSDINQTKLARLRPFYDVLDVWLDGNMWHKSLNISSRAQSLGLTARSIKTTLDPKEHNYSQIKDILNDI